MALVQDRLARLPRVVLAKGKHNSFNAGHCATETVAWLAGEEHTDHPQCLSPILGQFLRTWNDQLDEGGRQKLKPYLPRTIGSSNDGHDELRGWLCADWLIRVYTPAWLELGGVVESAAVLRGLQPVRNLASVKAARPSIDIARKEAAAAGAAAWDAAGAAAWAAAGAAAWDAAGAAAWAAAGDAAWDAAWAAAGDVLEPTTVELQASALVLLDELIDPAGVERRVA